MIESGEPKEHKASYNRWSERATKTFKSCYPSIEAMGKVYVYLMSEGGGFFGGDPKPICWWSGNASEFAELNPEYKWKVMKNDMAIGKVDNDYEAGLIQLKMTIHDKSTGEINWK